MNTWTAWRCGKCGMNTPALGLAVILGISAMVAQRTDDLRGPIRGGFSVAEADRATGARKYALWGESATPLTADRWEIQGPRLELYGEGDTTNLMFQLSRCYFDRKTERITSSEPLRMWSGDGYLQIQGEGFALDLKAPLSDEEPPTRLWVSNRVEAIMNKRLFAQEGALPTANARPGVKTGEGTDVIRIVSNRLEYGGDRAEFLDKVLAEDADGRLETQKLSVDLSPGSPDVREIRASGGVRFEAGELRVEASEARYDPAVGRLELDGDPHWVYRQRPGKARRVILERVRQALSAEGEVRMELPEELFAMPALPGTTAESMRQKGPRGPVLVLAERLEVEPRTDGVSGQTVLLKNSVMIEQGEDRLRCEEFRLRTEGEGNALASAQAMGSVLIERGADRLSCGQADYDVVGASASFSGKVAWESEGRSGAAEQVWLDLAENWHRAEGGVRMRFERGGESLTDWLAGGTEGVARDGGGGAASVEEAVPIEVESERFEYRGTGSAGTLQRVAYEGEVTVKQGDRMHLNCDTLRAVLGPETNQVQSVVADGKVEIRATDANGYRLARGDRAVYGAEEEEIVLTGSDGVDFFVIAPSGVSRGVGRQAVYRRATDLLILAGDPAITTPEGELVGEELRLDRRAGVMSATGPWSIRLPLGGLELPRLPAP